MCIELGDTINDGYGSVLAAEMASEEFDSAAHAETESESQPQSVGMGVAVGECND